MSYEDREYTARQDEAAEADGYIHFEDRWIGPNWEDGFDWDVSFDGQTATWIRVPGPVMPEQDRLRLLADATARIDTLKAVVAEKLGITTEEVTKQADNHVAAHVQSYEGHPGLPNAETEPLLRSLFEANGQLRFLDCMDATHQAKEAALAANAL